MRKLAWLVLVAAGCGDEIDPAGLSSREGYESWGVYAQACGEIPGHPGNLRTIYANEVARSRWLRGRAPQGSVIVKLIQDRQGGDVELLYTAIMRKEGEDRDDVPTNEGWLFTSLSVDGGEKQYELCWQCHQAAPFDGTWLDYQQPPRAPCAE